MSEPIQKINTLLDQRKPGDHLLRQIPLRFVPGLTLARMNPENNHRARKRLSLPGLGLRLHVRIIAVIRHNLVDSPTPSCLLSGHFLELNLANLEYRCNTTDIFRILFTDK